MNKLVLIGYSGHSLVAAEILLQVGYSIIGYLEKKEIIPNLLNIQYFGFEGNKADLEKVRGINAFPAIGDNFIRERVMEFLLREGFLIPSAISVRASFSGYSSIECGSLVCHGACVNSFARIGKGVIVNTGAIIEHECQVNDYAHIAPGSVLAGNVTVGCGSFIGANSVVKQGVMIGKNVIVGAGSVVLKDVPDNTIIVGNPARIIKRW